MSSSGVRRLRTFACTRLLDLPIARELAQNTARPAGSQSHRKLSHGVSRVRGLRSPLGNQSPWPQRPQMQHSEISHALLHLLICSTFRYTPRDKDGAVVVAGRYAPGHKKPLSNPSGGRSRRRPGSPQLLARSTTSELLYVRESRRGLGQNLNH